MSSTPAAATGPILVVEDEEDDALLISHAWRRAGVPRQVVVVRTGREAVNYLDGQGAYSDRTTYPLPVLILLDLKMPGLTGFDVLSWLQQRPDLRQFPVIVLSSSCDDTDRERALQLGARDYVVKPGAISELVQALRNVHARWLAPKAS